MRTLTLALFTTSLLALPACNNGGGEDSTASTGGSSSTTTVDPSTSDTTPATTTTPGDTTTVGTATESASDPVTESGDPTSESATSEPATTGTSEPGDTTGTSEPGDTTGTSEPVDTEGTTAGTTTGDPLDCAALGPKQCMETEACMPLGGGKLNLEKMCVQKPMFLGCVEAGACGDALTYACDGDMNAPYLFPSTCLPDGWAVCEAPGIDTPCN